MTEATGPAVNLDRISLRGLEAKGYHGVFPQERAEGQLFRLDLDLAVDTRAAAASDDLSLTVDYGAVAQRAVGILTGPPVDLIETVAARVAQAVLEFAGVETVTVTLHKPFAPVGVPIRDITVCITRSRTAAPAAAPTPAAPTPVSVPSPPAVPSQPAVPAPLPQPLNRANLPAKLTTPPLNQVKAVLGLGANLGDRHQTLQQAVYDLAAHPQIQVVAVSPLAATDPVGGPSQGEYLNAVLVVTTLLSPVDLLEAAQEIESKHGRVRTERWGARTLDIDIIDYQGMVAVSEVLELPHPRAAERAFVLAPWAALEPAAHLAGLGGGPVAQLSQTSPDLLGLRWVAQEWMQQPIEQLPPEVW